MKKKKTPFDSPELDAFVKGREIGQTETEESASRRAEGLQPAIARALALAQRLEAAVPAEDYFTWQMLMEELRTIAKKAPKENSKPRK